MVVIKNIIERIFNIIKIIQVTVITKYELFNVY